MTIDQVRHSIQQQLLWLKQACEDKDAVRMRELDERIRSELLALMEAPFAQEQKMDLMKDVSAIYQSLTKEVDASRKDIAAELKRVQGGHKAASAYLNASLKG